MTQTPTLDTMAVADPACWQGIGDYLCRQDVRLLSGERQAKLRAQWEDISRQEANLEDAILIGLVGGTGVGKSTFINALAGQEVSRSSDRRPTTDRVIVYRHVRTELPADVPSQDFAQPQVLHDNRSLEKVILFDFPDFDSAEEAHTHIIRRYLPFLDVLLVVVDDVKYADRRLYELLAKLDHDPQNIFLLLNKTDRLRDRYAGRTAEVIDELMSDLHQKLRKNSGLTLQQQQMFAMAARPVFEARWRQQSTRDLSSFLKVEAMLSTFQQEKHRRAAKERNIDARKRDVMTTLLSTALGSENKTVLEEAKLLVHGWRGELESALTSIPLEILAESERRGVRGARLRLRGPRWGLPFSLFFTLLGEFRRRRASQVEPTELGHRVVSHYRGFFDAIQNLQSRFASEFSGSRINLANLRVPGHELIRTAPQELAVPLREAVQTPSDSIPITRRWLAHLPAWATFTLAFWGKIHPILESALGQGDSGVIWASLKSLLGTLNPSFLIGTVVATAIVYLITAGMIWLREIQTVEHRITTGEQVTREKVRLAGERAVDQLDGDVRALYAEFEQLQALLAR